jgi:outer membrane protein OmpA-like peptidoglycan-associated protein
VDRHPASPVPGTLHALQRQAGNSGLQRIINAPAAASALLRCGAHPCDCPAEVQLRTELSVSHPQDPAEREADLVAHEVMRAPAGYLGPIQATPADVVLDRPARPPDGPGPDLAALIDNACRRGGQPLPPDSRDFMESRFGSDFSGVRVHVDSAAGELARQVGARAFTTGTHVFFAAGEFQPGGEAGQHLLAHELTHVVQQRGTADRRDNAHIHRQTADLRAAGSEVRTASTAIQGTSSINLYDPDGHVASIYFRTNESRLDAEDLSVLRSVYDAYRPYLSLWKVSFTFIGHADYRGEESYNLQLSLERAQAVAKFFSSFAGSPNYFYEIRPAGESEVPQIGRTSAELSPYRRVDIIASPALKPQPKEFKIVKFCGPDVTAWLINQMRANAKDIVTVYIRHLNRRGDIRSRISAFLAFYNMVKTGAPWDFKTRLGEKLNNITPCRTPNCRGKLFSVTLAGRCMTFEAPANIHFGYIGLHAGFSMAELLGGAGLAQMMELRGELGDDPKDTQAITKGFSLFFDDDPGKLTSTGLEKNFYENQKPGEGDPDGCDPCPTSAP